MLLHQFDISPFSIKLRRMMRYKGIAFEVRDYPLAAGKDIRKFNPTGKLPALEHEGRFINDSTDIAWYLEDKFPQNPVIPAAARERALCHALEDWADESLYFYEMRLRFTLGNNGVKNIPKMLAHDTAFTQWLLGKLIPGGLMKILSNQGLGRKSEAQILVDVERHLKAVSDLLIERDWLVCEHLSLADLSVYAMFDCFRDAPEAVAIMDRYPRVGAWMSRLEATTGGPDV